MIPTSRFTNVSPDKTAKVILAKGIQLSDFFDGVQKIDLSLLETVRTHTSHKFAELEKLSDTEKRSISQTGPSLARLQQYPHLVMGITLGEIETLSSVAVGLPVVCIGDLIFDKKSGRLRFTAVEGIFRDKIDMVNHYKHNALVYQIGIVVLGLVSGYCLVRAVNNMLPTKSKKRN